MTKLKTVIKIERGRWNNWAGTLKLAEDGLHAFGIECFWLIGWWSFLASSVRIYTVLVCILLPYQRGQLDFIIDNWFHWLLHCPLSYAICPLTFLSCCNYVWLAFSANTFLFGPRSLAIKYLSLFSSILYFSFDRLTMHSSKWFPFLLSPTWSCPPSKGLQNSTTNSYIGCNWKEFLHK